MRARNIKPGFFRNEQLMQVVPLGRLLFAGLWCLADREGRLIDRPMQIKWDILPADDCDADALLGELAARGFIRRYAVDGVRYIEVVNFLRHQRPHYKETASVLPPPTISPVQDTSSTRLIPDCGYSDCGYPSSYDHANDDRTLAGEEMTTTGSFTEKSSTSILSETDIQGSVWRISVLWQRLSGKPPTQGDTRLIERALREVCGEEALTALLHAKHLEYHSARSKKNFTLANLLGTKLPHHLAGLARTKVRATTPATPSKTIPASTQTPRISTPASTQTPRTSTPAETQTPRTSTPDWTDGFFAK